MVEARKSNDAEAETRRRNGLAESATPRPAEAEVTGTLASDEALAALRDKLSGGQS